MWLRVCRCDEVAPGEIAGFEVAGLPAPVLVANVGGTLLATASVCPHEDVSLLGGRLAGTHLICPGHGYELDLATGRCVPDERLTLRRYPTRVRDGQLFIMNKLFTA